MSEARLKQLIQYYEEAPGDPFNAYALALEYQKHDVAKAKALFEMLRDKHPDYLPTYYSFAKLCESLDLREEALSAYQLGMAIATEQGEAKTLRELKSAYDELIFE